MRGAGGIEEGQLTTAELSQVAAGLWSLAHSVRAPLAVGVAAEAASRTSELTIQQLCDCISGVAICGLFDKPLMQNAASVLCTVIRQLSQENLCNVAAAYARTGANAPELFAHLAAAVHLRLEEGALSAEQATTLAWAFSVHGIPSGATISHLFHAVDVRFELTLTYFLLGVNQGSVRSCLVSCPATFHNHARLMEPR